MAWLFLKNREFEVEGPQSFIENLRHYTIEADFDENYIISSTVQGSSYRKYIGRIDETSFKLEKIARWDGFVFINPGMAIHRLIVQPLKIKGEFHRGSNNLRLYVYRSPKFNLVFMHLWIYVFIRKLSHNYFSRAFLAFCPGIFSGFGFSLYPGQRKNFD